eukprot:SAG31_NODE_5674_length_2390_cov_36.986469_2_plen_86_part_00
MFFASVVSVAATMCAKVTHCLTLQTARPSVSDHMSSRCKEYGNFRVHQRQQREVAALSRTDIEDALRLRGLDAGGSGTLTLQQTQ